MTTPVCYALSLKMRFLTPLDITLDAEKAFDRVSWSFLKHCMYSFIRMVMALYVKPSACIAINGSLSESLTLQQGTRQRCCLSPSLFLLTLEPLIQDIKQNSDISGVNFNNIQVKLAAYADDILKVTENPDSSISALVNTISTYSIHSEYKLNSDKSEVKPLNIHCSKEILGSFGLTCQTGYIKYLGIEFGCNIIGTMKTLP